MARTSKPSNKPGRSKSSFPSTKESKESGYAKRQLRKEAKRKTESSDVYEYAPEKTRRSKTTLDLDREEALHAGLGEDETEELRARLIGENEEDEMIDSADDEEIDSDAAFEASDDERFAGFFSAKPKKAKKTKKSSVRFAEVDLDENDAPIEERGSDADEDDEEEVEDDEFIDVLDILDGRGEPDNGSEDEKPSRRPPVQVDSDEDSDSRDSDSDDEKEAFLPSDDEDLSPEALDELNNFISTLDTTSQKRKAISDDIEARPESRPRKRRMLKEQTEAGPENEFRAQSSGAKLNLEDLLAPLASDSSNLASLKKSTKVLTSSSSKAKTLSAPLAQRAQERLDREAAYDQTKEEVDKWKATMTRIREAEHLSFPLQAQPTGRVSNLELTAKFKPSTQLESSVDALLKSAKLREEDIQHTEETMLQMNQLSVEEVAERRAELRKMRELMSRAEIKAKRVSKIKSKTYRKIKRKERERLEEQVNEALDSDDEDVRMKREVERARERATLRHKNTGKWAKQMKGKNGYEEGGRTEIEEMLERGEKLKRRIAGKDTDESEEEESDEDMDIDDIKQNAFEEFQKAAGGEREDVEVGGTKSKIFEMKFMKDAMARQQQGTDKMVDDFMKELGGGHNSGSEDSEEETREGETSGILVSRTGGRAVYRPGAKQPSATTAGPSRPPGSSTVETSVTLLTPSPEPETHAKFAPAAMQIAEASNPWLAESESSTKVSRKKNEIVAKKDSKDADKSKNKLKKQNKKTTGGKEKAQDDAAVEISLDNVLTSTVAPAAPSSKAEGKQKATPAADEDPGDDDSDTNSEIEGQEKIMLKKGKGKNKDGLKPFEQRDLVALAFAGDDVVRDFQEAKAREIAADAPKEVDTTIPGWGSWGGTGLRRAPPKPHLIKKVAGVDPKTRADFSKSHVIISEKRDKKAAKYTVKDLPYPYTSRAQYERRMEQPLGVEWNTRVGFQRGTLPKVVKKMGTVIDPLEKHF